MAATKAEAKAESEKLVIALIERLNIPVRSSSWPNDSNIWEITVSFPRSLSDAERSIVESVKAELNIPFKYKEDMGTNNFQGAKRPASKGLLDRFTNS